MTTRHRPRAPASPTPPDLAIAPELAALCIADVALDLALAALVAAHPELVDDGAPLWRRRPDTKPLQIARQLSARAGKLQNLLRAYHAATLDLASRPDDDLPF